MTAALALVESVAADPFGPVRAMNRMAGAGFTLSVRDGRLLATPFTKLSEQQRAYLRTHKTALVDLLEDAEALHHALVVAGPAGLGWKEGTPADWSDDRLLASGEVLYGDRRMVSRHGRRFAAESAPPGPDILPDISAAPLAETTSAAATWADKRLDTPPDDPLATRIAQLTAAGWAPWNARAKAQSEALEGGAP